MELKEMIEKGEAVLRAEEQAEADKRRKADEQFQAIREWIYEQVRLLLPEAVRPYLDTSDDAEYSAFVDNDEHWGDGQITYSYKPAEVQTLRLLLPGCAPIMFVAEIGEPARIRYFTVAKAVQSYGEKHEAYYSPRGYDDRIEDLHIALAMAAREYKKFMDIEARCWGINMRRAAEEGEGIASQARNDNEGIASQARNDNEEIASQARNDKGRDDYLREANKMMDQFHNTGYPNDLNCAMTYSMMGILDYLKSGAALTAILMDQDELDESVKIWGSDDK